MSLIRDTVLAGKPADTVLRILEIRPPEAGNLDYFRTSVTSKNVKRWAAAPDPKKTIFRSRLPIGVQEVYGLVWKARKVSVVDADRALALWAAAWTAVAFLPQDQFALVGAEALCLLEAVRGNALRRQEKFPEAEEAFKSSAAHAVAGPVRAILLAEHLSLWASLLIDLGRLQGARTALSTGRVLADGDEEEQGRICSKLGSVAVVEGDSEAALQWFLKARELASGEAARHLDLNLALATAECGDVLTARHYLAQYRPRPKDSDHRKALVERVSGLVYRALGEPERAMAHLEESVRRFLELGDIQGVALSHLDIARLLLDRGETARVIELAAAAAYNLACLGVHGQPLVAWATVEQAAARSVLCHAALDSLRRKLPTLLLVDRSRPEQPS